jgi:hypothetical protein
MTPYMRELQAKILAARDRTNLEIEQHIFELLCKHRNEHGPAEILEKATRGVVRYIFEVMDAENNAAAKAGERQQTTHDMIAGRHGFRNLVSAMADAVADERKESAVAPRDEAKAPVDAEYSKDANVVSLASQS